MASPGFNPPSVVGMNPFDPNSITAAQEANRQAGIDTLRQFQAGIGNSQLAQGVEGLGARLAANPDAIDPATYQAMQSQTINTQRAQQQQELNDLRNNLGAQGRLGTGAATAAMTGARMQSDQDLTNSLQNLAVQRAMTNQQSRVQNLGAASGALGGLAGIGQKSASQIADIFNNTQIGDQFNQIMKQLGIGMGGSYQGLGGY